MKNFIDTADYSVEALEQLLSQAAEYKQQPNQSVANNKILGLLFFEASTRTYFSFISAMQRLGGSYLGFADGANTSLAKGESLEDTAKVMSAYCDVMVVRHGDIGSMQSIADVIDIPLISAGEGSGLHPSQTLTDLFTIQEQLGRLDVKIGLYGDLKYGRTNHSLLKAASRFGASFYCIAPDFLQMPQEYIQQVDSEVTLVEDINQVIADLDVLYVSRVQKERLPADLNAESFLQAFKVDNQLIKSLPEHAVIMHPLPRVNEIAVEVDSDPRTAYFEQAANGVPVRMALLQSLLS